MNKHPDPLDWVGDLFAMLARDCLAFFRIERPRRLNLTQSA